jgi:hypothetical protein
MIRRAETVCEKATSVHSGLESWIDARQRFGLSHAHVQMARELGMNPKKLGKLANHDQEPWKLPLPQFIAALYVKRLREGKTGYRQDDRTDRGREAGKDAQPQGGQTNVFGRAAVR